MNATYPVKSQSLFLKFAKYLFLVLDKLVVANIGRIPPPDQVGEGQPRYSTSETIGIILKSTSGANWCAGGPVTQTRVRLFSVSPVLSVI